MKKIFICLAIFCIITFGVAIKKSYASGAYYFMGDGTIRIGNGYRGAYKVINFRNDDGNYNPEGLKQLNDLYGADWGRPEDRMSLRLIELLDFLEGHFNGKGLRIISGYRSPDFNQSLKDRGKLAASSSLHLDAEAIDIIMDGVPSSTIYDYLISKDCCGVGYYHGKTIHIDTGPPRFWDEKTSGTEKKEPPLNEHITIKTNKDIYMTGEAIDLKFLRVTDYPIGVAGKMELTCKVGERAKKEEVTPRFLPTVKFSGRSSYILKTRQEAKNIVVLADKPKSGDDDITCQITTYFCEPKTSKMPDSVTSNTFVIKK